jgi:hypothetical protein
MLGTLLKPRSQVIIVAGIGITVLLYHNLFVWPAEIQVREKQTAFLDAIEEGDNAAWDNLLSEQYRDQWDFNKVNALISLQDIRSQFMAINISWTLTSEIIESSDATLTGSMKMEATGIYLPSDIVTSRVNRLETPFIFTWKKESWLPWSWKLIRIENSGLDLDGYKPGAIKRRLGG